MHILYHKAIKNHLERRGNPNYDKEMIISKVVEAMKVPMEEIQSNSRLAEVVAARHILCYLLSQLGLSTLKIGKIINKDHSTVVVAIQKVKHFITNQDERTIATLKTVGMY